MTRALCFVSVALAVLGACKRNDASSEPAPSAKPSAAPLPIDASTSAVAPSTATAIALADAAPAPPITKGTATLVVQRVDSECSGAPGENFKSFLGQDVFVASLGPADLPPHGPSCRPCELRSPGWHERFVEVLLDGEKKPRKVFPLCMATPLPDGGTKPPHLDMWEICHAFPKCTVEPTEASPDRAEVTCGKETFTLESSAQGTVVKGAFGERVVAPVPLRIAPTKRTNRSALIDC